MEGIAGTFGHNDKPLVRAMLSKLIHRGPDVGDSFEDDAVTMGARRRSVGPTDRAKAIAEENGVAVASDSYLFNREFVRMTVAPGLAATATDSQLVLAMYKVIGLRLFGYLDGAYSIAIIDHGRTILARDRYGLKPLYISGRHDAGAFSSEMKSQILAGDDFVPFPPGHLFLSGKGYTKVSRKEIPWAPKHVNVQSPEAIVELLAESTSSCLQGAPGFNILLSGGLDSSVVAAAAASITKNIRTVCVGTRDSVDLKMARKVADHLGTDHTERTYDMEAMLEVLDSAIYSAETFDYPLVRSCVPNIIATRMFSDKRRPTLCGEGGDEIFAGYDFLLDVKGDEQLAKERRTLLKDGHLTGFQRVDRMTAASSLDGRMPFMSQDLIDYGLSLGKKELLGGGPERNKLALRKAYARLLPREVVWRRKQRFSDGAGSINSLVGFAESTISDREFEKEKKAGPRGRIRTKEELLYYRLFNQHFPSKSASRAVGYTARP